MTHLIWRNGRAYFRYRLPPELRAIPKPKHWPTELDELVSESNREKLKHELSRALGTRDEREAKRRAAIEVARVESVIQQAREFLVKGPKKNLSATDIRLMAERYGAGLIVSDMDLRKVGIGLRLPKPGPSLAIKLETSSPPKLIDRSEPGLTPDDLGLLRFAVSKIKPEISDALARQRPTKFIKDSVRKALNEAGIELEAGSAELRELEIAFLAEYSKALEVWETRNAGRLVPNPVVPGVTGKVPTIQAAFESWKAGSGTRGESLPAMGAVEEAFHAVRRFVELQVFVLTYLFDGSPMRAYLQAEGLSFSMKAVADGALVDWSSVDETAIKTKLRQLVTIYEGPMNDTGIKKGRGQPLSSGWFDRADTRTMKRLKSSTIRFFEKVARTPSAVNAWTSFNKVRRQLAGKGYARGFIPVNAKATNDHIEKRSVAYLCNIFHQPVIRGFFEDRHIPVHEEMFALSEMIQWLWRSRIRRAEPISVFVPSERMRLLLKEWLGAGEINMGFGIRSIIPSAVAQQPDIARTTLK